MPPQLKELNPDNELGVDSTPVKSVAEITRVLEKAESTRVLQKSESTRVLAKGQSSPTSVRSSFSGTPSPGMGKKSPSLVFDMNDLELVAEKAESSPDLEKAISSPTSMGGSFSGTPPRGMGKKRPSLVFDVDDLELCMALQEVAPSFLKRMNESHSDIIEAFSMAFGDHVRCSLETDSAVLTGLDRDGFLLDVTLKTQNGIKEMAAILRDVRVPYQGEVKSVEDLYVVAERMQKQAFDKLGFLHKARNGYYPKAAKKSLIQTFKAAKANPMKTGAVAAGMLAFGIGITMGVKSLKKN